VVADQTMPVVATALHDHWEWRPDWALERPCLMWYVTFARKPALARLARQLHARLAGVGSLDLIPVPWLHLTLDEVGFVDALSPHQVEEVVESVRVAVAGWSTTTLTLGPVTTMEDSVVLRAGPTSRLTDLHHRLASGTTLALGREEAHDPEGFHPHVSLAYANRTCDPQDVLAPLAATVTRLVDVEVSHLALVAATRRDRHYQWTVCAEVPLGG
jgi:2'-5' RNA ligase